MQFTHISENFGLFQSMLSAVVHLLYGIHKETSRERKRAIIDLAAAAYPDVRPWQAKKACTISQTGIPQSRQEEMNGWYYSYLTLLLHPTDGHDAARRDPSLVKVRKSRGCISLFSCKNKKKLTISFILSLIGMV